MGFIGWDMEHSCVVDGGGVFGVPKYFYLVNGFRNKGSLHCHGLLSISGALSVEEHTKRLEEPIL